MRIALVSYEFSPETAFGGIATYTGQAAALLSGAGHSVEVFAATHRAGGFELRDCCRVNLVPEMNRIRFSYAAAHAFAERHACCPFDVVESPEFCAEGREILRLYPDVPHVVKLHTPSALAASANQCRPTAMVQLRRSASQVRAALQSALRIGSDRISAAEIASIEGRYVEECDVVVSPSKALLEWAGRHWSLEPRKTMLVPNPYTPSGSLLGIVAQNHGKVAGFFGRLEYRKGIADIVAAIPLVLRAEPEARFRFVGRAGIHPGTREPFDTYIYRKLGRYCNSVTLTGFRAPETMPHEYSLVDVCVFPSIWENFPNVCLEAMAAGRAIVGSCAGGMAEMLAGEAGLLVQPRSADQIATAVLRFFDSPELRAEAGRRARRRVLECYAGESILPLMEESYRRAIAVSRQRGLTPIRPRASTLSQKAREEY